MLRDWDENAQSHSYTCAKAQSIELLMIRINKGNEPAILRSEKVRDAFRKLANEQNLDISSRRQRVISPRFPNSRALRRELLRESLGKCVYCEQRLDETSVEIDRFRPARGAIDLDGLRSEDHYFWLAYSWDNLYACCRACNTLKGARFPVASSRVPLSVYGDLDGIEHPLLLNPGRLTSFEHLVFELDGTVTGESIYGNTTIDILGLNRSELVAARIQHMASLEAGIDPARDCADAAVFAALTRQVFAKYPSRFPPAASAHYLLSSLAEPVPPTEAIEAPDVSEEEEAQLRYFTRFPQIASIEVDGLCGFSALRLTVPITSGGRPGALVLLGENGVGKTSVLKCLAIVLQQTAETPKLIVEKLMDMVSSEDRSGYIRVTFDTQESIGLVIDGHDVQYVHTGGVSLLSLAYGPTRLSPSEEHPHRAESGMSQTNNLFDPYSPLRDASAWLSSLPPDRFDYAAAAIKGLLSLPDTCYLKRSDDGNLILVDGFSRTNSLDRLSHGYRSVLALVCDIMAVLFSRWSSIDAAQGVVLIDELENHLHPSWKLRLVTSLRIAFPRVQFIVTTHDPLCLRGFDAGEVALLRRDDQGDLIVDQNDLPAVSDLRIDQILTSAYFGLRSTVDPSVERLFEEYSSLLEREDELGDEDRERLAHLKMEVSRFDIPGLLPRDRVMYAAIDKFLATSGKDVPQKRDDFDDELKNLVNRIVRGITDERGRPDD